MIIHVGSKNLTKINGVKNVVATSKLLSGSEVVGVEVDVEEFGHPKSLEETISGAKNRALTAFKGADISVGLESGLLASDSAKSGFFETTVCAIYNGKAFHIGLGPSFEWPKEMIRLILDGQDGSQAFKTLGLTNHEKIGSAEGSIFILTNGKINREKLNELVLPQLNSLSFGPPHYSRSTLAERTVRER